MHTKDEWSRVAEPASDTVLGFWFDHEKEIQKLDKELVELHVELESLKKEKSRIFAALKGKS